jgi:hypothetical protein
MVWHLFGRRSTGVDFAPRRGTASDSEGLNHLIPFWILDFGFWIGKRVASADFTHRFAKSAILFRGQIREIGDFRSRFL